MHILYLCQLVPYPPDAGPKVRAYYTLRYLAQRHAVTLLAFSRPDDRPEAVEHLKEFCAEFYTVPMRRSKLRDAWSLLASLLTGRSFVIQRDYVPEMADKVDELLAEGDFDAVHADQLWMAQYSLRVQKLQVQGLKVNRVLDEHNACFQIVQRLAEGESNPIKRWVLEREWRALKRYEAKACAQFDHLVTVTKDDRNILSNMVNNQRGEQRPILNQTWDTIPICVDTEEINPVASKPGVKDVLHMGTMFWMPNVEGVSWFGREAWPRVKEQIPEATFTIVGKNPAKAVQDLAEGDRSIRVTGYVPDPQPCLEAAGVFIVPLFAGSGMRVKIVDAWRWGLPVVSTTIGAEGIEYRDGENILIADTAEDFARAVVRALSEPELNRALRQNGRRWVEEHYDWRRVYPAWDEIYGR